MVTCNSILKMFISRKILNVGENKWYLCNWIQWFQLAKNLFSIIYKFLWKKIIPTYTLCVLDKFDQIKILIRANLFKFYQILNFCWLYSNSVNLNKHQFSHIWLCLTKSEGFFYSHFPKSTWDDTWFCSKSSPSLFLTWFGKVIVKVFMNKNFFSRSSLL